MSTFHEFHHQLVIGIEPSMTQFECNSPVAIAAFILDTDLFYCFLLITMLFWLTQMA